MFVGTILVLLGCIGSISTETFVLNVRDNGKICSAWTAFQAGSISYQGNAECISAVSFENNAEYTQMRLCCQGMPLTTVAPYFPKECGKQLYTPLAQRIIGGSVAREHSWPWQVLVQGPSSLCGGTLIDSQHVLTAAHCFDSTEGYKVIVGLHDKDGVHYMEQEIDAAKVYVHEQYDTVKIENDVAVIYLSKPVEITDKVNFICLPGAEASMDEKVYVSGWGKTSVGGETSGPLKQTALNVMDCGKYWGASQFNNQKQICAGTAEATSCNGDSGGPLMYNSNGQWYLNGVVSFGNNCNKEMPAVYARVSYYLPWIKAKMALQGH